MGGTERVIDIVQDGLDRILVDGNPVNERVESEPDLEGTSGAEWEVVVDVAKAINGVDVEALLRGMDRKVPVGVGDV